MNPENDKRDDADSSAPAESSSASIDTTPSEESASSADKAPSKDSLPSDVPASDDSSSSVDTTPPKDSSSKPADDNSWGSVATNSETFPKADTKKTLKLDAVSEGGRREDRRSLIQNINLTLDYIGTISRDKKLHFRSSDQLTSNLLIGSFILALGFATLPFFEMNAIAAFAYILADALLFAAITVFVISRFGIIRAMEPRHALVCWHLMVGTGLLALVIGFNVVACVVLVMMRERLPLLFSGG